MRESVREVLAKKIIAGERYGLNCVPPPKRNIAFLTLAPQNVTLFGDRVFTEVIKVR